MKAKSHKRSNSIMPQKANEKKVFFWRKLLMLMGWKVVGEIPEGMAKAVVIAAPHTSNFDFIIGYLGYLALGIRSRFLMKEELFIFPFSLILKALGGIKVARNRKNSVVDDMVKTFKRSSKFYLTITPEATRSKAEEWKDGFYRICSAAEVSLILGKIDYKRKEVGVIGEFKLTHDYESDIKRIKQYYSSAMAKHPELF